MCTLLTCDLIQASPCLFCSTDKPLCIHVSTVYYILMPAEMILAELIHTFNNSKSGKKLKMFQ